MTQVRILIVEDEFIVARDLQAHLEKLGYTVCGRVNSGEKAFEHVSATPTDLVLMDIMLKGQMNGIEAAAAIRSKFRLPIIYVTANTNPQVLEQAKITEPFGFIVKPFNERELHANIEMSLYKHRIEQQLRASEEQYRKLIENANEIIAVVQDGVIRYANPRTLDISGYAPKEVVGRPFAELIHPDDRALALERHQRRLQGEEVLKNYTIRMFDKWKRVRWGELRTVVIEWEGELATLNFLNDITERKLAEDALKEQKALLDEIFNGIQEGLALLDEFQTILFCNPAYAALVGVSEYELVGKNAFLFFDDEARSLLIQEMKKRRDGQGSTYELPLTTMHGAAKVVRLTVSPRFDQHGRVIGEFVTMLDITDRKRAEEELRRHKEQLELIVAQRTQELVRINQDLSREIVERQRIEAELRTQSKLLDDVFTNIQEGVGIVDEHEFFTFCNPALASIFGETVETLIGQKLDSFSDGQGQAKLVEETAKRRHGESTTYELPLLTRAGQRKYIQISASPRFQEDGVYAGAFGAVSDITARKQDELALQQAKDAAEAANRAKTEFLANMSHELRTPLNGVLGYAQLLKRVPELSETARDYVETILRSGQHLLMILNDIIDLAKIETGRLEIEPTAFDFRRFVTTLVEMSSLNARQKGIQVHYDPDPHLPLMVSGDEKRLRQILFHLLGNAVKFTTQGSVTLRILDLGCKILDLEAPQSKIKNLKFEIIDTGIGIAPEQLEHIFDPFVQLNAHQRFTEGTGLGLTISRRLARMMGSDLHVESTVNHGSRFWFEVHLPEASGPSMLSRMPLEPTIRRDAAEKDSLEPIIPPSEEDLRILEELILIGDVLGVQTQIERLRAADSRLKGFTDRLEDIANALRISEMQRFVQGFLNA